MHCGKRAWNKFQNLCTRDLQDKAKSKLRGAILCKLLKKFADCRKEGKLYELLTKMSHMTKYKGEPNCRS